MLNRAFDRTGRLIRFILRRERVKSVVWILSLVVLSVVVPLAFDNMFASPAERIPMAETMKNPAMIAMLGPFYADVNDYTVGAMQSGEMLLLTVVVVAIMNIFLVVRHTRGDEERGRVEVIRSLPVGRLSTLGATMSVALAVNATLALLTGVGMAMLGIESMGFGGCMLFGLSLGATGFLFAAIACLFAQLCVSSKSAVAGSLATLGIFYMLRAFGDLNSETLSRISPLGLILRTEIFIRDIWWPLWVVLLESVVVAAIALYLNAIRDMDQGFIPSRPGRRTASPLLRSPLGLAFRLLRNTLIGWLVGMVAIGVTYGSVMGDLELFLNSNELLMRILPQASGYSMTELFITMLMAVVAMIGTVPVLTAMMKVRSEEKHGRTEHLLARAVSRQTLFAGYFGIALVSSVLMLLSGALSLWASGAVVMETPIALGSILGAMMVYLPAVWVIQGVAALLIGLFPEHAGFAWGYLGFSFFAVYVGRILQLPDWVKRLSPFGYVPELPVESLNYGTLALLTLLAVALVVAGFAGYAKRDVRA